MIMIGLIDTILTKLGIDSTLFIIGFGWMIIIAEILTNKDFNTCILMVPICHWLVPKQYK